MNRKILVTAMAVVLIFAVYVTMYVILPQEKAVNAENNTQDIDITQKTVVLDSGHGGIDPGKESSSGILEKNVNLAIANELKQLLQNAGINVVMTRNDDNGLYQESDTNKKIADMKKRCAIIDECKADIVVSIHQNSYQNESVSGAQVFYYTHSVEGKKLAGILQNAFKTYLDSSNQRVEKADSTYYMLLHTSAPTVIAECGFLSNPEEAEMLNTPEYQKKVAEALYNGIIEYFTMS
jgi:N-acetylmuramoyl-L-alanine amidase